ncbi:MAG: SAM-dependent DNA methyltransferase [Bacteroidetes bacterium]|nr:MAG: SAM-dependent DNA methyltransferase [Bacteroidota bacterium]TAG89949.1 MAG: SAM-dependent DNA methyltransferase [Bacteroidota bacterium]
MKLNERAWAGQIIAWIKELVANGKTIFQDATNDAGIKLDSGKTKFPDILLFTDKISGIIFNGWELKFPDTSADDNEMLVNALEKAEKLKSNSFVTWNGTQAIIWLIENGKYELSSLKKLKIYPQEPDITTRKDLAENINYQKHEPKLKVRLAEIIHDLEVLYQNGDLKVAINISDNIITAIKQTSEYIFPQFKNEINELKADNEDFRDEFNKWKILESATLKILASSSRRVVNIDPELVLANFVYYKLIGKILFYLTLSENLSGKVGKLTFTTEKDTKNQLNNFFNQAKKIDYQAVFDSDFTDKIPFNENIDKLLFKLISVFNEFDFKVLPNEVIGYILENLVPKEEKQQFGQYFTPEKLAYLVAFPAIKNRNYVVFDPTSGTGTFLNVFYKILKYYGTKTHQQILAQIFGNDISHFPAVLSVINLYKQEVHNLANFPRVTRADIFNLLPKQVIKIPDNVNIDKLNDVQIPEFDAIISNFPFIQQEDIPNNVLSAYFRKEFQNTQKAFLNGANFEINERSDYYIYYFYHSLKFLKDNGYLSAITSNAWLGKNYGLQFKQFLLDNFHIQYIVKSNAEHWFKDSKVSTIFVVLRKAKNNTKPTKFVTFNFKIDTQFTDLQQIENFYTEIANCEISANWTQDQQFKTVYYAKDGSARVSIVEKNYLENSLETQENWAINFIAQSPLSVFDKFLINPFPTLIDSGRGTRTGWDKMHIISKEEQKTLQIENDFLQPILKSSTDIESILHSKQLVDFLFICDKSETDLKSKYPNAYKWVKKWEKETNNKGELLADIFAKRKPFWYTLKAEETTNIFISINPNEKLFFSFTTKEIGLNQRLVAIRADKDTELITALLNSILSLLIVELNGVSRNLGALDLNADFFKTKMKILNPNLLKDKQKQDILASFASIKNRPVESYKTEFQRQDRQNFDNTILKTFGFDTKILKQLYEILMETIENRVEMKNR